MFNKLKERTLETEAAILRDCFGIGFLLLLIWLLGWIFGRDFIHKIHSQYFKLPDEQFDMIHYSGMAFFKILILVVFFIPWMAIQCTLCCKDD